MTCPKLKRERSEPASKCQGSFYCLSCSPAILLGHTEAQPCPSAIGKVDQAGSPAAVPLGGGGHQGSPCPHLSADVQVIVLWFQVQLSDRHGLYFQPAILLLVLPFPLHSPLQQLQVKVLLTLPLATEQEG